MSPDIGLLGAAMRRRLLWWATFVGVGLAAHSPLLLDDGVYLDDWWALHLILDGRLSELRRVLAELGSLYRAHLEWALAHVGPGPTGGFKWASWALLVISSGLVAKLVGAAGLALPGQAQAIGLLALVAPAHRSLAYFESSPMQLFDVTMFLSAGLLVLRAESSTGAGRRWRRGLALLCFWVSFDLASLLVVYVGLACGLALWTWHRQGRHACLPWLKAHGFFLVLPWAFWLVRLLRIYVLGWEHPLGGGNVIRWWDVNGFSLVYLELLRTYAQMAWAWAQAGTLALLGGAFVIVALLGRRLPLEPGPRRAGATLALLGAGLFILSAFPYAAVGKGFGPPGAHWGGHLGVLFAAPLGLLAVGVLVALFGGLTRTAWGLVLALLGAWSADAAMTHVQWHAEAVKWKSVCQQVGRSQEVRRAAIVAIVDRWPLGMHDSVEGGNLGRIVLYGGLVRRPIELAPSFTSFFGYFCAPGAPKVAIWVSAPEAPALREAVKSVRDILVPLSRTGYWSRGEFDAAVRDLDASAGLDGLRELVKRNSTALYEGLRLAELENGRRAARARVQLFLLGLPPGPAVETRLRAHMREPWGDFPSFPSAIAQPSPSVLVTVQPGRGAAAIPVGLRGWWREARRLWGDYHLARLRGPAAVEALLDRVAVVEVFPLTR